MMTAAIASSPSTSVAVDDAVLASAVARASRRLIWFLVLLYFFAVLDRVNVGVAGLVMRRDLHLSASDFGLGAGIFFLGYVLCEVPSNLALARFGARRWLARVVVTWGLAAMAVSFSRGATSFAAWRFLLGLAEAGFFPGVIFYLTLWFPSRHRARITALFFLGVPLSNAFAAVLSTLLLRLDGAAGLAGWQWLFLLEGAPPVLLGILVLAILPDSPARATWLSVPQRQALITTLARENQVAGGGSVRDALLSPVLWLLGAAYFGLNVSLTTFGFWLPQVVRGLGRLTTTEAGLITGAVLLPSALAMLLWSRRSDRRHERVAHTVLAVLAAAAGWGLSALSHSPALGIALLLVAAAGTYAATSIFWAYPAALLSGRAAAGGIALVGALGNLGGFVGPWVIGHLREASGSFAGGFAFVAATLLLTALICGLVGRRIAWPQP